MSDRTTILAQPEPFFGWLDYDAEEAQRMREVLAAFDDKQTVDSLGLGVIRDAISDQLFPGVSTIQTRARYFLFVPWVCRVLESKNLAQGDFNRELRSLEVALIESLRKECSSNEGVIGYEARKSLVRMPSSVYWNGIEVFGIRHLGVSITQYRSMFAGGATMSRPVFTDDEGSSQANARGMWDLDLPEAPEGFPRKALGLQLSSEESEYLTSKITTHVPETMIAELARDLTIDRSGEYPWDVPLASPPPRLATALVDARAFSELMQGAQALYNLLLARRAEQELGRETAESLAESEHELEGWGELIKSRHGDLQAWADDGSFWHSIAGTARVPFRSRRFVESWIARALEDPKTIGTRAAAEKLVVERERELKRKLARLTSDRALETWGGSRFSPGQMNFRWQYARIILNDLQNHREASVAQP